MARFALLLMLLAVLAAGCGGGGESDGDERDGIPVVEGFEFTGGDITTGSPIDPRYTCDGDDVSPALTWARAPEGTIELALIVEDPDAPSGTFTHWLTFGLPPASVAVPQRVPATQSQIPGPTPLTQGRNDFGDVGYGGPCPPEGETHTYLFRLLALNADLDLPPGADRASFDAAGAGHVLAEARLEAPYARGG
jgi:Raf kinase inhibitor-like YbhB/YbcL family protein